MTIRGVHTTSVGDRDQRQQLGLVTAATQLEFPEPFRDLVVVESHQFFDEIGEHDPRIQITSTIYNHSNEQMIEWHDKFYVSTLGAFAPVRSWPACANLEGRRT